MAKFNVEINLDWIGEDGDIDTFIKNEITASVINRISKKAEESVQAKVETEIEAVVSRVAGAKLNALLEEFFTCPRTVTDRYGDVKTTGSLVTMLKKQCDEFMDGKVDPNNGTPAIGYARETVTRVEYVIKKQIQDKLESSIRLVSDQIGAGLKNYIDKTLRDKIGDNVVKIIGLDRITEGIKA